jgi:transcriptional regulator with XRE-family HTH domain
MANTKKKGKAIVTQDGEVRITNLRKRLIEKNMGQRELAEITGCTEASICKYCYATRTPTIGKAIRIAKALDTTVEELFSDVADMDD